MILTVLKIIGLILLVLLLLLLLLLGILLLVPIRYEAEGLKPPEASKAEAEKQPHGEVRLHWLFHLLRFTGRYDPQGLQYRMKLLWFTILEETPETTETAETVQKEAP